jgi:ketosteroid isomerase-like protein
MNQVNMQVSFDTKEVIVFGDLAYESGTFTVKSADKSSGQSLGEVTSRHIHIFQRQKDGKWKTWRMMTNSPSAPAGGQSPAGG